MTVPGCANPLLMYGDAGVYQIERSLRFNSSDSAFLSRTPASAGNRRTWTFSAWAKRSSLGVFQAIFNCIASDASYYTQFIFETSDKFVLYDNLCPGGVAFTTTQVFRDTSAWFYFLLYYDTTQSTASAKAKLYINGIEVTQFDADNRSSLTADSSINRTAQHVISGRLPYTGGSSGYLSGYLADIHFIDGQALTPSSFTEVSATTGQLVPKAYTGSFGTNGFWLKFSDNSAATATTLGKDYSGNSNNWTPNNLSVTAGAGNDSLVDTPTSYGTDTGAGGEVRGNYCTLNPLNINASLGTSALSNGNLDVSGTTANGTSTIAPNSGKWYAEFVYTAIGSSTALIGVSNKLSNDAFYGATQSWQLGYTQLGKLENAGSQSNVTTYTTNDVIGVAFDCSIGQVTFYKNGSSIGSITNSAFANVPVAIGLGYGGATGTNTATANFGQRPFAYTAPSGFKALCDTNLPAPVVAKPNTVMDVALWTGNGGSQTITLPGAFSPDFVWIKRRSSSFSSLLYDTVRGNGPNTGLISDSTTAEGGASDNATYGYLNAFNSTGFALTAGQSSSDYVNTSGQTYVGWCWDAGTSTVTNTQGSITSSVRANASSGFSVVTYTVGNNTSQTIGHGLGVAPQLIIVKERNQVNNWQVYHASLGNGSFLYLNATNASGSNNLWNNTSPTSTVFSIRSGGSANFYDGKDHVAYCFAPVSGYSSFGSYTGNGSASDNTFVYTGMRPRFVMLKRSDSTGNWVIWDAVRNSYNVANSIILPNSSAAEYSPDAKIDILSNGFKVRDNSSDSGTNGATYIYAAFAESPFQYSRAR